MLGEPPTDCRRGRFVISPLRSPGIRMGSATGAPGQTARGGGRAVCLPFDCSCRVSRDRHPEIGETAQGRPETVGAFSANRFCSAAKVSSRRVGSPSAATGRLRPRCSRCDHMRSSPLLDEPGLGADVRGSAAPVVARSAARPLADATDAGVAAAATALHPRVLRREGVAGRAMRGSPPAVSALEERHRFQVLWVHTRRLPTQVDDLEALWDRPHKVRRTTTGEQAPSSRRP